MENRSETPRKAHEYKAGEKFLVSKNRRLSPK